MKLQPLLSALVPILQGLLDGVTQIRVVVEGSLGRVVEGFSNDGAEEQGKFVPGEAQSPNKQESAEWSAEKGDPIIGA